jgi:hypothetical protein
MAAIKVKHMDMMPVIKVQACREDGSNEGSSIWT